MKKILIAALAVLLLMPLAFGQRAGHNKILTLADGLTGFYQHATPGVGASLRQSLFDTTSAEHWLNLAGNVVTYHYPASETLQWIGCTSGTEVYDLNDDVSDIAYVFAIDGDGYRVPIQPTSLDQLGNFRDETGIPKYYSLWGNQIYLAPVNYDSDSIIVHYYASNNTLGDSSTAAADTSNIEYPFLNLWTLTAAEMALNAKLMRGEGQYRQRLEELTAMREKEAAKFAQINRPLIEKLTE